MNKNFNDKLITNTSNRNTPIIGILMLDTSFTRIPGVIGNPSTFDFPVRYEVVKELFPPKKVLSLNSDISSLPYFIKAAKKLESEGVKAITTSCGFLAFFQNELREEVQIPVFTSSLIQVPMVSIMLGKNKSVGIITASSKSLSKKYLRAVGIFDDLNIKIIGMEEEYYFPRVIIEQSLKMKNNEKNIKKEMVGVAERLIKKNPEIRAIVLECTNMPPYSKAIQDSLGLPVFDIVTLTNMLFATLNRKRF